MRGSVHPMVRPLIHPSVCLSVCPSIHPFIHSALFLECAKTHIFDVGMQREGGGGGSGWHRAWRGAEEGMTRGGRIWRLAWPTLLPFFFFFFLCRSFLLFPFFFLYFFFSLSFFFSLHSIFQFYSHFFSFRDIAYMVWEDGEKFFGLGVTYEVFYCCCLQLNDDAAICVEIFFFIH